jgi:hypothetical protein
MKVRIIKTSEGYIPQVFKRLYGEESWYSVSVIAGGNATFEWSNPECVIVHASHLTQWGAMRTLKKWLKVNVEGTAKLEAFKKELQKPNVVYESEV